MARPHKHDEHTRRHLLDVAEALLAEGGPDSVTVRAVADAAGTSTRAVYSIFGSMPGLIGALAARGFGLVADRVSDLAKTDDPLAELIEAGAGVFRGFARERPHLFRLTYLDISEDTYRRPEAFPALMASYDALASRFERAVACGVLPARPIIEYVFSFHSFTSGLAFNELSCLPPPVGANFWGMAAGVDFEALWRRSLAAFLQGLAFADSPASRT